MIVTLFPITFPLGSDFAVSLEIIKNTNFQEYYTGLSINEFNHCSFSHHYLPSGCLSVDELSELNKEIIRLGRKRLIVTLNVVSYRESWRNFLFKQLEQICEIGAYGVVVSNLGILNLVKSIAPHLKIHISSVAGATNAGAIKFFAEQGADRIILPRSMKANEVVTLALQFPDIEIEAFITGGGCAFSEHSCNLPHFIFEQQQELINIGRDALHLCPHRGGCQSPSSLSFTENNRDELYILHPGYMSCGICYIQHFLKAGVHALKVTGRTQPCQRLIEQAQMIEKIMINLDRPNSKRSFDVGSCKLGKKECLYEKEKIAKILPQAI